MVLLQRPYASAELHGAATIAMVGSTQGFHQGVVAVIMRFLRHQQEVALHMAALTKVKQHHAGLAVGHAGFEHGIQADDGGLDEYHGVAGWAGEGYAS